MHGCFNSETILQQTWFGFIWLLFHFSPNGDFSQLWTVHCLSPNCNFVITYKKALKPEHKDHLLKAVVLSMFTIRTQAYHHWKEKDRIFPMTSVARGIPLIQYKRIGRRRFWITMRIYHFLQLFFAKWIFWTHTKLTVKTKNTQSLILASSIFKRELQVHKCKGEKVSNRILYMMTYEVHGDDSRQPAQF